MKLSPYSTSTLSDYELVKVGAQVSPFHHTSTSTEHERPMRILAISKYGQLQAALSSRALCQPRRASSIWIRAYSKSLGCSLDSLYSFYSKIPQVLLDLVSPLEELYSR